MSLKKPLQEIERIQSTTGIFTRTFEDDNLIHFSAIPWLNFTSYHMQEAILSR
jgi:chloramphenicol O-acetyltransferase type A